MRTIGMCGEIGFVSYVSDLKVTVHLQRPNFVTFFSFAPDVAKESI